ncbi:hypothetical protein [Neisseria animalis]|uniref:Uncharacterized protein n=1 Tax=Neisseria animalis TaxID=492 RepID=A0A5P3MR47_NEIAN|nr:hypothetical protein [Neisseria animalis]QEY23920.1 hypothetical protein D0T90_04915 [Neisseria animalis]ROW31486.1 hypothetical protein CGZ60_10060 [Neisseria animalis]VEE05869.1 putative inner membrane protein [Neisseria animalis]
MNLNFSGRFAPFLYILFFFAGFLCACLLFNPQDYLADLAPTITAVAAIALVWLAYLFAAAHIKAKTAWLQREKQIQQEAVQPVVHTALQLSETQPEMLVFKLYNNGKGLAQNLRFQIAIAEDHAAGEAVAEAVARLPFFSEGLDKLAAGETLDGIFADRHTLLARLPEHRFDGLMKLVTECEDVLGNTVRTETFIDLSPLNAAVAEKPRKKLLY